MVSTLKRNYCLGNKRLRFHHWGACGTLEVPLFPNDLVEEFSSANEEVEEEEETEEINCMKACSREYRPICGDDGETYSNPCMFSIAQCQTGVKTAYEGECKNCQKACSREYSPMCGSDGETYSLGLILTL